MHPGNYYELKQSEKKSRLQKDRKKSCFNSYLYRDRNCSWGSSIRPDKLCTLCLSVDTRIICCGKDTQYLSVRARPPRKNASKKKWKEFLVRFAPEVLEDKNWWKRKNKK